MHKRRRPEPACANVPAVVFQGFRYREGWHQEGEKMLLTKRCTGKRRMERDARQCPPMGKNDTAMETAIRTMMIHSSTSMRRLVVRSDILP